MKNVFRKMCLVSLVMAFALSATVQAGTVRTWNAGATSTAWETPANWDGGTVPAATGDDVYVTQNRTGTYAPVINSAVAVDFVAVGWLGWGATNTSLTVNSGSLTTAYDVLLGKASVGTLNVNAGTVNVGGPMVVGWAGGTGTLNMNGGTVNSNGLFWFAPDAGSYAHINILDGVFNLKGGEANIGANQYHVEIQKGTFNWYNSLPNGPETIQAWAQAGLWTGYGNKDNIRAVYDAGTKITTITAVPEPATMALLSLGGIALLRRNRKK